MATSFLSSTDISMITGAAADLFETFTLNRTRTITVYKQPIKNISNPTTNSFPGYGPASNNNNITSYTIVSGTFPAVITYIGEQSSKDLHELKKTVPDAAKVRIRVEKNCSDYIENGKTEKIVVNNDSYNVIAEREVNSILGLNYYHYYLGKTT
jgi:hypothetical protein